MPYRRFFDHVSFQYGHQRGVIQWMFTFVDFLGGNSFPLELPSCAALLSDGEIIRALIGNDKATMTLSRLV